MRTSLQDSKGLADLIRMAAAPSSQLHTTPKDGGPHVSGNQSPDCIAPLRQKFFPNAQPESPNPHFEATSSFLYCVSSTSSTVKIYLFTNSCLVHLSPLPGLELEEPPFLHLLPPHHPSPPSSLPSRPVPELAEAAQAQEVTPHSHGNSSPEGTLFLLSRWTSTEPSCILPPPGSPLSALHSRSWRRSLSSSLHSTLFWSHST